MKKPLFLSTMLILCLAILVPFSLAVQAQDATPAPTMDMSGHDTAAPAPTMDMSGHDHSMPMTNMAGMGSGDTTIRFAARVGDKDFACGMTYDGLGSDNSSVQISDFRVYVSNVRLINADKQEVPLALDQDGLWQYKDVALLDFEDGSAGCGDGGNEMLRTKVTGTVPEGTYTGIMFDVGVPYELNHLDISTAPSPLNLDAMFWAWSTGYKFIRIDMTANGNSYLVHLGSTGCNAPSDTEAPSGPCANPNIVTVRFDNFDVTKNFVIADVATLVQGITLSTSVPKPPGCMSGPDDPDCAALFPNLGLPIGGIDPSKVTPQTFLRVG